MLSIIAIAAVKLIVLGFNGVHWSKRKEPRVVCQNGDVLYPGLVYAQLLAGVFCAAPVRECLPVWQVAAPKCERTYTTQVGAVAARAAKGSGDAGSSPGFCHNAGPSPRHPLRDDWLRAVVPPHVGAGYGPDPGSCPAREKQNPPVMSRG